MANTMKRTNKVSEEPIATPATGENAEGMTVVEQTIPVKAKKKFAAEDLIPCISITPGEMFMVGEKSKTLYTWADADDVIEVEYQDLAYAVRTKSKLVYKPRFIVQDDDFLAEYKELASLYGSLYSAQDLRDILNQNPKQMEKAISALPEGAKDSIKSIAMSLIDSGKLDSIQKIKILDNLFGTEMLLKLTNG